VQLHEKERAALSSADEGDASMITGWSIGHERVSPPLIEAVTCPLDNDKLANLKADFFEASCKFCDSILSFLVAEASVNGKIDNKDDNDDVFNTADATKTILYLLPGTSLA